MHKSDKQEHGIMQGHIGQRNKSKQKFMDGHIGKITCREVREVRYVIDEEKTTHIFSLKLDIFSRQV